MKKIYLLSLLIVIDAANAFGQSAAKPSPTPFVDNDVVKISTNLVQVDVTVLDSKGKIVRDLRPDEVEIYQNGKKQEIANFSFISGVRAVADGKKTTNPPAGGPTATPPEPVKAENVRRIIALVVDDLNLSYLSTNAVRDALKKFVDQQMLDGDVVAIIRSSGGIEGSQQLTNDKKLLLAAIEKIRFRSPGSGNIGSFESLEYKGEIEESMRMNTDEHKKADQSFRSSVYAMGTMGALGYVVRGMTRLPGRKMIVLFSDGFALYTKDVNGDRDSYRVIAAIKDLADKAARASAVIHTIDPRGAIDTSLTDQDDVGQRSRRETRQVEDDRNTAVIDTQDGLKTLAYETGGIAVLNGNDIGNGVRKILDDQSYYLVGYVPNDETFNANQNRFNNLTVKVKRSGTTVRYRRGFLNVLNEKLKK